MGRSILLCAYEQPGYGGHGMAHYWLYDKMCRAGLEVSYLNIIDQEDAGYLQYRLKGGVSNPRHLTNVHTHVLREPLSVSHPTLTTLVESLAPDVVLADDWITALLMKEASPDRCVILMTSNSRQVSAYLAARLNKKAFTLDAFRTRARGGLKVFDAHERSAVEASDFIVANADVIRGLLGELFPNQQGKIYSRTVWRAEWIADAARAHASRAMPFTERDIDVIFVATSWLRPEKNLPLVRRLVSRCRRRRVHIVGEGGVAKGATAHGPIADREALFELLGRSKTIVCPSLFDPAPDVLWEASVMGCNIITSPRCGTWMLCNEHLLAESLRARTLVEKIERGLQKKFDDNLQSFIDAACYDDLIETIHTEISA